MRYIVLLVVGLAVGYFGGWQDAQTHKQNIVERLVGRAGGATRGKYGTNIDSTMKDAADPATNRR